MNQLSTSLDGEDFDSSAIEREGTPIQESTSVVSRHEKSLGLLTSKFVALLQSAEDGILDLKAVSNKYLGNDTDSHPGIHTCSNLCFCLYMYLCG